MIGLHFPGRSQAGEQQGEKLLLEEFFKKSPNNPQLFLLINDYSLTCGSAGCSNKPLLSRKGWINKTKKKWLFNLCFWIQELGWGIQGWEGKKEQKKDIFFMEKPSLSGKRVLMRFLKSLIISSRKLSPLHSSPMKPMGKINASGLKEKVYIKKSIYLVWIVLYINFLSCIWYPAPYFASNNH